MIQVLICDDHAIVRAGLAQMLSGESGIAVCGQAESGAEALRILRMPDANVDVLLLDIALPQRDGLDVLAQVRGEFPRLPVLMLSTYPERQYATRCLKLGAHGYLNKSADPERLVEAVRKVAGGGTWVSAAVAEALAMSIRRENDCAPHELLSQREHQVFQLLISGASASAIAQSLSLSPNTVSTYRARIMEKLGTGNDVETALYAVRHGLISGATEVSAAPRPFPGRPRLLTRAEAA